MAQKLYTLESTGRCLNATNRHLRLCSQVKGTEVLTTAISPSYEQLKKASDEENKMENLVEESYDKTMLCDYDLDNLVRKVSSRAKEFDRDNPGARVWETLFPGDIEVTSIVQSNMFKEPVLVSDLIQRVVSLGQNHALAPLAGELQEQVNKTASAINDHENRVRKLSAAKAEVLIAKNRLVRQYESNVLQAMMLFGRSGANRLFPLIRSSSSNKEMDIATEPESELEPTMAS